MLRWHRILASCLLLATGPLPARSDSVYWTAARLDAALGVPKGSAIHAAAAPAGIPHGRFFGGIPRVGTFFAGTPSGNTSCTGSVVRSPGRDLVLTAGHCAWNWRRSATHLIFVPRYAYGRDAAHQPYGYFPVRSFLLDPHYRPAPGGGAATDLDFAFARLGRDAKGRRVEDVTGAFPLAPTPGYRNRVTVIGYPESSHNPRRQAITCTVPTTRLSGYRQMRMLCGGYFNGVSGSPWVAGRRVIGVLGGRNGGGEQDWVSYSPYLGPEMTALYARAQLPLPG